MRNDGGFEESLEARFERCYRLGRDKGLIAENTCDFEKMREEGARFFKSQIFEGNQIVVFEELEELAEALTLTNFSSSSKSREIAYEMMTLAKQLPNRLRFNYRGGEDFGHLEFRIDYEEEKRGFPKPVYVIEDHPEEIMTNF